MSQDAEDRMRGWLDRAATRMSEVGALLSEDVAPTSSDSPSPPPPPGTASGALLPLLPAAAVGAAAPSGSSTVSSHVNDISPQGVAAAPGTRLGVALSAAPTTASHAAQQQPADAIASQSMAEPAATAAGASHSESKAQVPQSATEPAASGGGSVTSPLAPGDGPEAAQPEAAQQEEGRAAAGSSSLQSHTLPQTQPEASASAVDPAAEPAATAEPAAQPAGRVSPTASVGSAPSPSSQRSPSPPMSGAPDSAQFPAAGGAWPAVQTPPGRRAAGSSTDAASGIAAVPGAALPLPAGPPEAAHSNPLPPAALVSPMRQPSQGLIELLDGFNGSSAAKAPDQRLGSAAAQSAAAGSADAASEWADVGASPQQQSMPPSAAALRVHAAEQGDGSEFSEEVDSSEALLQQVRAQQNGCC